jgi:drug/metabolite transporter (DMT)-like permease
MRVAFLLIAAILFQGTGNLCLSQGMKDLASAAAAHPIALTAIASPLNVVGVLLLVGFFAIFTTVLARADLSVVVPIVSFEIVLNVALAHLVIHEVVSPLRWAGTLLITCGVALVAFSAQTDAGAK